MMGKNPKPQVQRICKEEKSRECMIDPTFGDFIQREIAVNLTTGQVIINSSITCLRGKHLVIMMLGNDKAGYLVGIYLQNNDNTKTISKFVIRKNFEIANTE
jgi:hypothetical protein